MSKQVSQCTSIAIALGYIPGRHVSADVAGIQASCTLLTTQTFGAPVIQVARQLEGKERLSPGNSGSVLRHDGAVLAEGSAATMGAPAD
jgi:hypothetical protein